MPDLRRALYTLLLLVAAGTRLLAQTDDFLLTPAEPPAYTVEDRARIQSCARDSNVLLAAWGMSVPSPNNAFYRTQIVMQRIVDGKHAGDPVTVTSDSARPFGVVAVTNLKAGFLILWNDERGGIWARGVERSGAFTAGEFLLAPRGSLANEAYVWVTVDGDTTRLTWYDSQTYPAGYYTASINPAGNGAGAVRRRDTVIYFDDDLLYNPPGIHVSRAAGACRLLHADGTADPRPIPDRILFNPHYIDPDTSVVVLEPATSSTWSLVWYSSIFGTEETHRATIVKPSTSITCASVCRDSSGRLCLVLPWTITSAYGPGTVTYVYAMRCAVDLQGRLPDTVQLGEILRFDNNIDQGFSTHSSYVTAQKVITGDFNYSRWTDTTVIATTRHDGSGAGTTYSHGEDNLYVDNFGNIFRVSPEAWALGTTSIRSRVETAQLAGNYSRRIELREGTARDTLSAPIIPLVLDAACSQPALRLSDNTLIIAWRLATELPTFVSAVWYAHDASPVVAGPNAHLVPSQKEPSYAGTELSSARNSVMWRWSDACAVLHENNVQRLDGSQVVSGAFLSSIWIPSSDGHWYAVDTYYHDGAMRIRAAGYDPNTQHLAREVENAGQSAADHNDDNCVTAGIRYSSLRRDTLGRTGPRAVLPFQDNGLLLVRDSDAIRCINGARIDTFSISPSPDTLHTITQHLLGDWVLRLFPASRADTAGRMADRSVRIERFGFDGSGRIARTIKAPSSIFDPFVYERPADSMLFIVWGGDGVHLMVLDRKLNTVIADTLASVTTSAVHEPVCTMHNDTLITAWSDGRQGVQRIYARLLPLAHLPSAMHDDEPARTEATPVITGIAPMPAFATATVTFTSPDSGNAMMEIADASGKVVGSRTTAVQVPGESHILLDLSGMHPGAYWVRIRTASGISQAAPLIVVR